MGCCTVGTLHPTPSPPSPSVTLRQRHSEVTMSAFTAVNIDSSLHSIKSRLSPPAPVSPDLKLSVSSPHFPPPPFSGLHQALLLQQWLGHSRLVPPTPSPPS